MVLRYNLIPKLVFVPSSTYLSEPIFNTLKEGSDTKKELLLYFNLPEINKVNKDRINSKFMISLVDLEVLFSYLSFTILKRTLSFIRFISDLRKYKKRIYSWLDQENPEAILTTGETISTLICLKWARDKKKIGIVIQPSFVSLNPFQNREFKYDVQNLITIFLSGCRINSNNKLFGTSYIENFVFYFNKSLDLYYERINHSRRFLIPHLQFQNYFNCFKSFEKRPIEYGNILLCVQNYEKLTDLVYPSDAKDINKVYIDILRAFPESHFIIKIHPRQPEDEKFYKCLFQDNGVSNLEFVIHEPLLNLFKTSSLHIASGSFTTLEAILSGVPSINIRPDVIPLGNYLNGKVESNAYTSSEAIDLIRLSMSVSYYNKFIERRKEFINESFCNLEETTPRYILDVINNLILST